MVGCDRRHQALPQGGAGVRARVAQLDAGRLDQEMTGMLQEQMTKALKYFTPVTFYPDLQCDILVCSVAGSRVVHS